MGAGWNSVFDSNVFDNTRVLQSNTNIGSTDCFIYSTPYVTNYQLWKNNTWLGTNRARQVMIGISQSQNATIVNNRFINVIHATNPLGTIYIQAV